MKNNQRLMSETLDQKYDHFQSFIQQNTLITSDDKILVAASGGKDSTLLTHLLSMGSIPFEIAHVNYQLRGEESDRDELFLKKFCKKYEIPLHIKRVDAKAYCKQHKLNIQAGCRKLRYTFFDLITEKYGFTKIATGHHKGDQLETIILNLTKGTGIRGLKGIPIKNKKIIRPLLAFTRTEIETLVEELQLEYVDDSSNKLDKYDRNKVRKYVLPTLLKVNGALEEDIQDFSELMTEQDAIQNAFLAQQINKLVEKKGNLKEVNLKRLLSSTFQKSILYQLCKEYNLHGKGFQTSLWSAIENRHSGLIIKNEHQQVFLHQERLIFASPEYMSTNQLTQLDRWKRKIQLNEFEIQTEKIPRHKIKLGKENVEYIDTSKVAFPVTIRPYREGDYFYPLGMGRKKKKLSRFFKDLKLSPPQKKDTLILENADGKVIWVFPHRLDQRFAVQQKTKEVLQLKFKRKNK